MPQYIFAYGTLRLNTNQKMAAKLSAACKLISLGYITEAKLYKIDWFPALVHDGTEEDIVIGDIFKIEDDELLLELDEYEGFGVGAPPYEYRREKVKVYTDQETYDCWVYWYNIPIPENAEQIESGDFLNP
ncbi:MAG TPA: gamma-glutamylcyclotransferase family protein [Chitinophagales bacterium]|nr:gamma-glutamylcyclotransferase family protein [Chitinophagales bacterium]